MANSVSVTDGASETIRCPGEAPADAVQPSTAISTPSTSIATQMRRSRAVASVLV